MAEGQCVKALGENGQELTYRLIGLGENDQRSNVEHCRDALRPRIKMVRG